MDLSIPEEIQQRGRSGIDKFGVKEVIWTPELAVGGSRNIISVMLRYLPEQKHRDILSGEFKLSLSREVT